MRALMLMRCARARAQNGVMRSKRRCAFKRCCAFKRGSAEGSAD